MSHQRKEEANVHFSGRSAVGANRSSRGQSFAARALANLEVDGAKISAGLQSQWTGL